jgi:hypothetical protein
MAAALWDIPTKTIIGRTKLATKVFSPPHASNPAGPIFDENYLLQLKGWSKVIFTPDEKHAAAMGFETPLRKVFRIERDYEVCFARFGAEAKRVVLWIGRNLSRGMHCHFFGPFADQIDDFPDGIRTDV